jgi:hypothetical protein
MEIFCFMTACIIDNKIDEDALVYLTEAGLEQLIPVVGDRMKFLHSLKSKRSASEKQNVASSADEKKSKEGECEHVMESETATEIGFLYIIAILFYFFIGALLSRGGG